MKKSIMFVLAALFIMSVLSMGALAYRGVPDVRSPYYSEDVHEQLEAAIESGDYDTFMHIREENGLPMHGMMFSAIDEDNFHLMREMHEAHESGNYEKIQEIHEELGMGMMRHGQRYGRGISSGYGGCMMG